MKKSIRYALGVGTLALLTLALSSQSSASPARADGTAPATVAPSSGDVLKVGFVEVGPQLDKGWSQAHTDATIYLKSKVPGLDIRIFDKLNPADRPNVTLEQVVDNFKADGVKLIFTTSDDFGADTLALANKNPDLTFINASGDDVLQGKAPANLGNVMGRMEYMKMVAGCAAALTTQTKSIGFLGPLINFETRRLASSAYLGAKYCYQTYRKGDPSELKFEVKWIGFWFNIPGVTLDPTVVANSFYDGGADVVISGIDTTEGIVVAKQRADKGQKVWAIPYDYKNGCDVAPSVCLGVPYFNWGPAYVRIVSAFKAGTWKQSWDWDGPDWKNINNPDTSAVGFNFGPALSDDNKTTLTSFIADLGSGKVNLFTGPLKYQSGAVFLKDGETATDKQIWYMAELLDGMKGDSQPKQ
jgi:simple sugar transport system substrate-binding protein